MRDDLDDLIPIATDHVPSLEQQAIYDEIASDLTRHVVIEAGAGTGKSYTVARAGRLAPPSVKKILYAAYNSRIVEEMKAKVAGDPRSEVKTAHGLGLMCIGRYWENIRVEGDANRGKRAKGLAEAACGPLAPDPIKRLVRVLLDAAREQAPHATTGAELLDLAIENDCVPDEEWDADGFGPSYVCDAAARALELAATKRPATGEIDFPDMLFLPVRNRWTRKIYDMAFIDEAQDMTLTQLELLEAVVKGRIVVVGDRHQAIYRFRGADTQSLSRLKTKLAAHPLTLRTTYRCGKTIVAAANPYMPDLVAHPTNGVGDIRTITSLDMLVAMAENKTDAAGHSHDFILSRKNAPLATVAMRLLKARKRVRIQGKDIGAGLQRLVRDLMKGDAAYSIPRFLEKLKTWEQKQVDRAAAQGREDLVEQARDRAETIRVISDGVAGPKELVARIDELFDDKRNHGTIVCSSVHKAKGLEAERVFVLQSTLFPPVDCTCGHRHLDKACGGCGCQAYVPNPDAEQEERNIAGVAITRAKSTLVWVTEKV